MNRLNSERFQNFHFQAEILIFECKSQEWLLGWIPGFLWIHPKNDSRDFPENGHFDNSYFGEKFLKS